MIFNIFEFNSQIESIKEQQRAAAVAQKKTEKRLKEAEEKMVLKVQDGFTDVEYTSAHQKLLVAATKYEKNHPSSVGLEGFDALYLNAGKMIIIKFQ